MPDTGVSLLASAFGLQLVLGLSLLIQLLACGWCWRMVSLREGARRTGWFLLGCGLMVMAVRRAATLFDLALEDSAWISDHLYLLTSGLLGLAVYLLRRGFKEELDQWRELAEQQPTMVWMAGPGGETLFVNHQYTQYTGMTARDCWHWGWLNLMHPDALDRVTRGWLHCLMHGKPFEVRERLRRHDGAYRWHLCRAWPIKDGKGRVVRWYGSNTDVHDFQEATSFFTGGERTAT